ncbi:hypothetical protein CP533_6779 [Ophiocordyceps camponoti-saundersi (nom. inval.)]|nr:hypothetical protein CP533_6779 [Ophiocordyceps camponoti-saundersi (nom. inval.)]
MDRRRRGRRRSFRGSARLGTRLDILAPSHRDIFDRGSRLDGGDFSATHSPTDGLESPRRTLARSQVTPTGVIDDSISLTQATDGVR